MIALLFSRSRMVRLVFCYFSNCSDFFYERVYPGRNFHISISSHAARGGIEGKMKAGESKIAIYKSHATLVAPNSS